MDSDQSSVGTFELKVAAELILRRQFGSPMQPMDPLGLCDQRSIASLTATFSLLWAKHSAIYLSMTPVCQ